MNQRRTLIWAGSGVAGLVALLVLGILAGRIGGTAIRSSVVQVANVPLTATSPLVPGVPAQVSWAVPAGAEVRAVQVVLRDLVQEYELGQGQLVDGALTGRIPCDIEGEASLVLRDQVTGAALGFVVVEVLPPGPECVFSQ